MRSTAKDGLRANRPVAFGMKIQPRNPAMPIGAVRASQAPYAAVVAAAVPEAAASALRDGVLRGAQPPGVVAPSY